MVRSLNFIFKWHLLAYIWNSDYYKHTEDCNDRNIKEKWQEKHFKMYWVLYLFQKKALQESDIEKNWTLDTDNVKIEFGDETTLILRHRWQGKSSLSRW